MQQIITTGMFGRLRHYGWLKTLAGAAILSALMLAGLQAGLTEAQASYLYPFEAKWGASGLEEPGSFASPQAVAVGDDLAVYVTDLGNKRVQKFSDTGTYLDAWGESGSAAGQFKAPAGAAAGGGSVYIVDNQLHRVQKFTSDGEFVLEWGSQGREPGQFLLPNGAALGENGTLYVVDTGNQRVQVFDADGQFLRQFGSSGVGKDKLLSPMAVAVAPDGSAFVSDPGNNAVKKFGADGQFATSFDSSVGGTLAAPHGIAAAPDGTIYFTDPANDRIIHMNERGSAVAVWGDSGTANGKFKMPTGVALDRAGKIYISEHNGHRVQKFSTPFAEIIRTEQEAAQAKEAEPAKPAPPARAPAAAPRLQAPDPVAGDLTKPAILVPNDLLIEATGPLTAVDPGQATATDVSGIRSLEHNAPKRFTLGTNTIVWTAIDGAGNMAVAAQTVTVADSTAPTIEQPADAVSEASSPTQNTVLLAAPEAADAVGIVSVTSDAPQFYPIGQTIVTWTATDVAGNTASVQQAVIITDGKAPTIYPPKDVAAEASLGGNAVDLGAPTVLDNGVIASIANNAPDEFPIGNTTVTWAAYDAEGNVATAEQTVSIYDTTAPVITGIHDAVFEAESVDSNRVEIRLPEAADVQGAALFSNAPEKFPIGTTIITWTATDPSGNSAQAAQNITISDTTPPELAAPGPVSAEAAGPNGTAVELGEPEASDISGIASVSSDAPERFEIGTTVIVWTAADAYGNAASAVQEVTITDTVAPEIAAPAGIAVEATSAAANAVDLGRAEASDAVGVASISSDAPAFFPVGLTTVTWTAHDAAGNEASDAQMVLVEDTTAPEITAPGPAAAEAAGPDGQRVETGTASAADAVGVVSVSSDAPETFAVGTTAVTWTAVDAAGNAAQAVQNVTIVDTTAPQITAPADVSLEASSLTENRADIGLAEASDSAGPVEVSHNAPERYSLGTTLITWTATDAAGNAASAVQSVAVSDTTPPEIAQPEPVRAEAESSEGAAVSVGAPAASDAIGPANVTGDAPEIFPIGTTAVTWTAVDAAGNAASAVQEVTVSDTVPPAIAAPANITAEASGPDGNAADTGAASASDAVGVASISSDAPERFALGETLIAWTAADEAGNLAQAVQSVMVVDTTAPAISAPEELVLEAASADGSARKLQAPGASDAVSEASVSGNAPALFPIGTTIVTWNATDAAGNSAQAVQHVTVRDTIPPEIESLGQVTAEAAGPDGAAVVLAAPGASDAVGVASMSSDAPEIFAIGATDVTWTATDAAGNAASTVQQVLVQDTTVPSITAPESLVLEASSPRGAQAGLERPNATDAASPVTVTGDAPETFAIGQTVVTWTATDDAGNSAQVIQSVTVRDTTAPSITAPASIEAEATGSAGNVVDLGEPASSDTVGVASVANDAPLEFLLGTTEVRWTAADAAGNTAVAVQAVSITDTTPPEISLVSPIIIEADAPEVAADLGAVEAADLTDPAPALVGDAPAMFPLGTTVVTWNATDAHGNAASAVQEVVVQACGRPLSYYNLIMGSAGAETIAGTDRPDLIFGLGGADIIFGGAGNDCIFGGEGDDIILGQDGSDGLRGGEGSDVMRGGSGEDALYGMTGSDVLDGGDDADSCEADPSDSAFKCE